VPDGIRDHSNDDPTHTYLCGNDAFMIPLLLLGAAFALFYFASNKERTNPELTTIVRKREGVESNRTSRIFDHIALVNVARGMVIFVGILAVAVTTLGYTFWHADSPFDVQPSIWKASFTMKSSSDELVISVLIITTLTLVIFMWWGWSLRYESNIEINNNNNNESNTSSNKNKLKAVLLMIYTSFLLIIFDLIYVFFYEANNDTISIGEKATATTLFAQIKGSLLSERWIASKAAKILKPRRRFNFLVTAQSIIMLVNSLTVPCVLVLLLDKRCYGEYTFLFFGRLLKEDPHVAVVPYTYCGWLTEGVPICPTPQHPNDGYVTKYFEMTFTYPWRLSDQCPSAVIETYSPVVLLGLIFTGILQPALWWLSRLFNSRYLASERVLRTKTRSEAQSL